MRLSRPPSQQGTGSSSTFAASSSPSASSASASVSASPSCSLMSSPGMSQDDEPPEEEREEFEETDPTARYGRYRDMLGQGAIKKVYRAFDTEEGIEVAWNQALLRDIEYVQPEVEFLRSLKHKNIIRLYSYWIDAENECVNFITELCSSNFLQFRKQHKHVCMKAVKDWAKQILRALVYLHSQEPAVVHRDLKCENIFVNCSNGKVKIGDFGLTDVLDATGRLHVPVGTPEFMAPEMFDKDYNELVDVYAFGMCMLQLLTLECPYKECTSLVQVYKKVTTGIKPKALDKVKDLGALHFINKCLAPVSLRPSASVLLLDPFLHTQGRLYDATHLTLLKSMSSPNLQSLGFQSLEGSSHSMHGQKKLRSHHGFIRDGRQQDMGVTGKLVNESTVLMRLRVAKPDESPAYNIEFNFNVNSDTPQSVAEEMVQELDFELDSAVVSDMISSVLASLKLGVSSVSCRNLKNGNHLTDDSSVDSDDASEQDEFWALSTIPLEICQQMLGNQMCSGQEIPSTLPNYLKAIA